MEKIIDLILKNWVFVVIIISVLTSLWSKINKSNPTGTENRPMKDMPSFGGGTSHKKLDNRDREDDDEYEDTPERTKGQIAPSVAAMDSDTVIRTKMVMREHEEGSGEPREALNLMRSADALVSKKPLTHEKRTSVTISQKNMAQAIIWSEILGPPRSKKPRIR
ncbi:hypothetical protein [Paenibacillus sp. KN14-4R]|uniref:hypothetical protein n=1 Tax=Paenibacillus sp. KN14-4R TaxID=3445773 RepID=UPI003FA17D47